MMTRVGDSLYQTANKLQGRDKVKEEELSYQELGRLLEGLSYTTEADVKPDATVRGGVPLERASPGRVLGFINNHFDPDETGLEFHGRLEIYRGGGEDKHRLVLNAHTPGSNVDKLLGDNKHARVEYTVPRGTDPRQEERKRNADADSVRDVCADINRGSTKHGPEQVTDVIERVVEDHGYKPKTVDGEYSEFSFARGWYRLTSILPGRSVPELRETEVKLSDPDTGDGEGSFSFRYHVEGDEVKHPRRIWYHDLMARQEIPGNFNEEEMQTFVDDVLNELDATPSSSTNSSAA